MHNCLTIHSNHIPSPNGLVLGVIVRISNRYGHRMFDCFRPSTCVAISRLVFLYLLLLLHCPWHMNVKCLAISFVYTSGEVPHSHWLCLEWCVCSVVVFFLLLLLFLYVSALFCICSFPMPHFHFTIFIDRLCASHFIDWSDRLVVCTPITLFDALWIKDNIPVLLYIAHHTRHWYQFQEIGKKSIKRRKGKTALQFADSPKRREKTNTKLCRNWEKLKGQEKMTKETLHRW